MPILLSQIENQVEVAEALGEPAAQTATTANTVAETAQAAETAATTTTAATPTTPTEITDVLDTTTESIMETTSPFVTWVKSFATWDNFFKILGVVIFILILWVLYKLIVKGIKKARIPKFDNHKKDITIRFIKYTFYTIITVQILGLFGINLSGLWGAAGIAGIAIGFAAQTSVSNLISGLFVITEGSLKIGDLIEVDAIKGRVDSINLLSVRINTLDNQMVRIPNSKIIDSNLKNISYNKVRRITIDVSISYDTDMEKALEILSTAPALCPTVLQDPAPSAWFDGFGDSGINMVLASWYNEDNFLQTKNDLFMAIKKVFDKARIEIPFNKIDVSIKE